MALFDSSFKLIKFCVKGGQSYEEKTYKEE